MRLCRHEQISREWEALNGASNSRLIRHVRRDRVLAEDMSIPVLYDSKNGIRNLPYRLLSVAKRQKDYQLSGRKAAI